MSIHSMRPKAKHMQTQTTFDILATACRYNSGRSILDSGDHYGRHHEKPPIAEDRPAAIFDVWRDTVDGGTIETAHYLAERCEHLDELQDEFEVFAEEHNGTWFDAGSEFMEERGYHCHTRDNVYNGENDLTQVFIWEVWTPNEDESDWVWADGAVLVVYLHTGCDVRGGYSFPVFLSHNGEYAAPLDFVCQYAIVEARGLDDDECRAIDERWQCGYASHPFSEVSRSVKRWFPATLSPDKTTICAVLDNGCAVKVAVSTPWI